MRPVTRRELLVDLGIAVVVLGASLAMLAAGGPRGSEEDVRDLDVLGGVLATLAALPLVARRRAPLPVFALSAATSVVMTGLGYAPGPPLAATVALYSLAVSEGGVKARPWLTSAVVGGLFVLHVGAAGLAQDELPTVPFLFGTVVWGGAWVIGDRVRERRRRIAELEERAARAEREAERERRLAAAEERTRIARELHDSAGHAINVILVQAGAARLLQERDPAESRAALETIEEVARETVGEIDHLVRALREDSSDGHLTSGVEPPLGLAALETLAERHRAAGLAVALHVRGDRRPLAAPVDRASYRILQEALTNASQHGLGGVEVVLAFGESALEITVTNPAAPGEVRGPGHGIVGMRERTALLGGHLEAGASDGVFRVHARLPYSTDGA